MQLVKRRSPPSYATRATTTQREKGFSAVAESLRNTSGSKIICKPDGLVSWSRSESYILKLLPFSGEREEYQQPAPGYGTHGACGSLPIGQVHVNRKILVRMMLIKPLLGGP